MCPWASQRAVLAHSRAAAVKKPGRKTGMSLGKCREKRNGRKLELVHEGLGAQGEPRIQ